MSERRVAFLGLGAIGAPMAAHLAAAQTLTVWNRTGARADAFARAHGSGWPRLPRGRGRGRRGTHLPADLARGGGAARRGLAARGLGRGALFWTAPRVTPPPPGVSPPGSPSSASPSRTRGERRDQRRRSRHPGHHGGADEETFARAPAILALMGSRIEHVGPVGSGHAVKAVDNALLAVNILAVGEGLAALVKAGVRREPPGGINTSSGRSCVSETLVPDGAHGPGRAPSLWLCWRRIWASPVGCGGRRAWTASWSTLPGSCSAGPGPRWENRRTTSRRSV